MYFAIPDDDSNTSLMLLFDKIVYVYQGWLIFAPSNLKSIFEYLTRKNNTTISRQRNIIIAIWTGEILKEDNPTSAIDDLFVKYMNNDPVVPFELEERKKKFPMLFNDYGELIETYIQEPLNKEENKV